MSETDRLELLDYYTLLGLSEDASPDHVREAFHVFALRYHPDRHGGGSPEKVERAAQIFRRGSEAYHVLLEPEMRRRYDAGLAKGQLRYNFENEEERRPGRSPHGKFHARSAKARPFAQKAQQAVRNEDWQTARLNLKIALSHDPGNEVLEARLREVDEKLTDR